MRRWLALANRELTSTHDSPPSLPFPFRALPCHSPALFSTAMDGESTLEHQNGQMDPSLDSQPSPSIALPSPLPPCHPGFPPAQLLPASPGTTDVSMEDVLQESGNDSVLMEGVEETLELAGGASGELIKNETNQNTSARLPSLLNATSTVPPTSEPLSQLAAPLQNGYASADLKKMDSNTVDRASPSYHLDPPPAESSSLPTPSLATGAPILPTPNGTSTHLLPSNSTFLQSEQSVASTSSLPLPPIASSSRPSRTANALAAAALQKSLQPDEPEEEEQITLTVAEKNKMVKKKQDQILKVMSRHDDLVRL